MVEAPEQNDRTVVVRSMKGARRCVECITSKTSVPAQRVHEILSRAQEIVSLAEHAICSSCFRTVTVYGLWWPRNPGEA